MKRGLQLLTLAPLIGCTDLLIKALGIGLAGLLLIPLCALLLAPLRARLSGQGLVLAALLIGATLASCAELALQLFSAELASALALFLPLLLLPCLAQALDGGTGVRRAAQTGLLFALTALAMGVLREALGHGSLFQHADWLLGPAATGWHWNASLPLLTHSAGGFILLGLIFALLCHFNQDDAR